MILIVDDKWEVDGDSAYVSLPHRYGGVMSVTDLVFNFSRSRFVSDQ